VIIGTAISFFVAGKILKPVTRFSEAANKVAKGDFSIRVKNSGSIQEIKDFEHNFNLMIQELGSIETLRNDFVSNISHEFKTPIAAIEGYTTLLQDDTLSDRERDEYTRMVIESARQLSTLSGNILSLSKLENQEVLLETNQFRLDEQIREAILLLENEWMNQNLELQLDLAKVTFVGDENLLIHVWKNLIDNAIKFSPPVGKIAIELYSAGDDIVAKFIDNGCGMPIDVQNHVFDKFYQGDTARKASGNGLGLPLAKRIIELHKGTIQLESKENKGTVFIVKLQQEKV